MALLKKALWVLLALLVVAALVLGWHLHTKRPQRDGQIQLTGLSAPVQVRYDEFGVPHLRAQNEDDLYRALGYVHAQDRLFQMEMLRRVSRGELAEVLGPRLLDTDRLFRTLGIRAHADAQAAALQDSPASRALRAYLDGINQYQATRPAPLEFELLGIAKRPFTPADTYSVAGYLAYSFAAAFRAEPLLTQVRDQLGADYLRIFDLSAGAGRTALRRGDWQDLTRLAALSLEAPALAGQPLLEGSNAWAIAGARTASGKPLLAGDPHIQFGVPAVWYEAQLSAPGFELYGHFQALSPFALLGHNAQFGWSVTMFQNDDLDLIAEPADAPMTSREETIAVKGQPAVKLLLRRSKHGPIVNDAIPPELRRGTAPIAMWWALLEAENPLLDAFHALNRADTLAKAREAARLIHAPGLNVVWANAAGDIAWWAAAKLPRRPAGVDPGFILDGAGSEADKLGWLPFEDNPHEENPARGYVLSANQDPGTQPPVPGYYNLHDRFERLDALLNSDPVTRWTSARAQALQLDVQTGYAARVLAPALRLLKGDAALPDRALLDELAAWDGRYTVEQRAPVLFQQLLYEIAHAALADELGEPAFENLRKTRLLDPALARLVADPASPWWDRRDTKDRRETEADIVRQAWRSALTHLRATLGSDEKSWRWGRAHTLTHAHPLGQQPLLAKLFNVGPLEAPGSLEMPDNMAARIGPAPWPVVFGPSTRRVVDFGVPDAAMGINPVGQSGVWGDPHYADQAALHVRGEYRRQWLSEADVAAHTRGRLEFRP